MVDAPRPEHSPAPDPREHSIERLLSALTRLSNEVLGSLPLMDELARRELGNTNYSILMLRAREARELIDELKARSAK